MLVVLIRMCDAMLKGYDVSSFNVRSPLKKTLNHSLWFQQNCLNYHILTSVHWGHIPCEHEKTILILKPTETSYAFR